MKSYPFNKPDIPTSTNIDITSIENIDEIRTSWNDVQWMIDRGFIQVVDSTARMYITEDPDNQWINEFAGSEYIQGRYKWYPFHDSMEQGFDTGNGYSLALWSEDRVQFNALLTTIRDALDLGLTQSTDTVQVKDKLEQWHDITVQEFRILMVQYSQYYIQLLKNKPLDAVSV